MIIRNKYLLLLICWIQFISIASFPQNHKNVFPGKSWVKASDLSSLGWSLEKLSLANHYADSIGSACVLVIENGIIIDQFGDVVHKYNSYSMRKSMLSALYGIYSAKGIIDINETLDSLGIDDNPPSLTKEEKRARIIDLLRARSGVYHPVDFETQKMKDSRPERGSHAPGTFWFYNNWDFNVLGTIFEKKSGLKIGAAFDKQIASIIGMEDYHSDDCYYISGPVSMHPAFQFHISSRDLARFGLLYLQNGSWGNKKIIPESWVEKSSHATEIVSANNIQVGGYEMNWWINTGGKLFPELDPNIELYAARGLGDHILIIIPSRNLVIVHRVANPDIPPNDATQLKTLVNRAQIGNLVKLILNAKNIN
jgi:CubicO group peptidase (beta-lactamase class C family)